MTRTIKRCLKYGWVFQAKILHSIRTNTHKYLILIHSENNLLTVYVVLWGYVGMDAKRLSQIVNRSPGNLV